jgi:hypothetical protein
MLNPRLTDCPECADISTLLEDIDCKITEISKDLYNNIIFSLNREIPTSTMIDLFTYKRILMYKRCNSDYVKSINLKMISNKVKLLKYK